MDLKMPLENGRADERVSRGQASERAVCVCEAESVEKGWTPPPPAPRHNDPINLSDGYSLILFIHDATHAEGIYKTKTLGSRLGSLY